MDGDDGLLSQLVAAMRDRPTTAPDRWSFRIREAIAQDESAMLSLLSELGYPTSGDVLGERLARTRDHPADRILVAEVNGEVAGWRSFT
jgi:hypothetical protein